ncbi:acyl-CoA dehydrogenase [Bordetella pertussis]|nr:acyl-CoA dehydrogenase [Bordetella pertussis]CPJ82681.1 acyl-CoA dehydrogenase [Bordetella pertussis]CPJ91177.1 acyl-CoA dehydrogenase [Bordetella pertussis]CPM38720.1 acyl-CoA dehydrogenase [Bordetella pertussis]CPN96739.1 acyl-CoA dehydrogenase [Bordetella pertussis]
MAQPDSVPQALARRVAAGLATLWQAALLIRHAPTPVGAAFAATRLHAPAGIVGAAPIDDPAPILARAWPGIC